MIQLICNHCKKPIDPKSDSYFDLPSLIIKDGENVMQARDVHACSLSCLQKWFSKNSRAPSIITAQGLNSSHGPAA